MILVQILKFFDSKCLIVSKKRQKTFDSGNLPGNHNSRAESSNPAIIHKPLFTMIYKETRRSKKLIKSLIPHNITVTGK